MSNNRNVLAAQARAKAGKGAARAIRRTQQVPAVIYGGNKEPILVSLPEKELRLAINRGHFTANLCELDVEGAKHLVLPRAVQLHPVSDAPEHVDFMRVTEKTIITVEIPIQVHNHKDCPGLVKGAVLNLVRHELEVSCPATNIPEEIAIDLTGMEVGDSVQISDLKLPANVTSELPENFTVMTLVAPSAMKSENEAATAAEGEAAAAASAASADAKAAADAKAKK